jgi:hypothetical protein
VPTLPPGRVAFRRAARHEKETPSAVSESDPRAPERKARSSVGQESGPGGAVGDLGRAGSRTVSSPGRSPASARCRTTLFTAVVHQCSPGYLAVAGEILTTPGHFLLATAAGADTVLPGRCFQPRPVSLMRGRGSEKSPGLFFLQRTVAGVHSPKAGVLWVPAHPDRPGAAQALGPYYFAPAARTCTLIPAGLLKTPAGTQARAGGLPVPPALCFLFASAAGAGTVEPGRRYETRRPSTVLGAGLYRGPRPHFPLSERRRRLRLRAGGRVKPVCGFGT